MQVTSTTTRRASVFTRPAARRRHHPSQACAPGRSQVGGSGLPSRPPPRDPCASVNGKCNAMHNAGITGPPGAPAFILSGLPPIAARAGRPEGPLLQSHLSKRGNSLSTPTTPVPRNPCGATKMNEYPPDLESLQRERMQECTRETTTRRYCARAARRRQNCNTYEQQQKAALSVPSWPSSVVVWGCNKVSTPVMTVAGVARA